MHLTIFLAAVTLLVLFSPADASSCQVPTPVGAFSASLYTALIVSTDPEIADSLELEGGEAALKLYVVIRDDLELFGLCNAETVAFAAAKGTAYARTLTLAEYFRKVSMAIGDQLYLNGRLDCDNSTSMALNLFALIKRALKDLDPSLFESQFQGVVHGTHQFYVDLGFNLQDFAKGPADAFTGQFKHTSKCNTDS